jgi:hypothetical protein
VGEAEERVIKEPAHARATALVRRTD